MGHRTMASTVSNAHEQQPVRLLRKFQRFRRPHLPRDWIILVSPHIWAAAFAQPVNQLYVLVSATLRTEGL